MALSDNLEIISRDKIPGIRSHQGLKERLRSFVVLALKGPQRLGLQLVLLGFERQQRDKQKNQEFLHG